MARTNTVEIAEQRVHELFDIPAEAVEVDRNLAKIAARLKSTTPVSYADCYAAGLSLLFACPVVTGDAEFNKFQRDVTVEWI